MKLFSAKKTLSTQQKFTISSALIVLYLGIYFARNYIFFVILLILNLIFLSGSLLRLFLIAKYTPTPNNSIGINKVLPQYSVLVPLYREVKILPHLVKSLSALIYDKSRLEIILILEEDDTETINAIEKISLPSFFKKVVVPHSYPKTKPKACNYALQHSSGEFITIYDAEDKPDPHQLIKAVDAFEKSSPELVCVQSKLAYYNADNSFLTSSFEIEYYIHFNLLLPAAASLDIPIPLGGTSNHFRGNFLRKNMWDSYNVTEDAELGFRIHLLGKKVEFIDSVTLEQAPKKLNCWLTQRSRWIKGYMQTYLSFSRHGTKKLRQVFGKKGYLFFLYSMFVMPFSLAFMPAFFIMGALCFTNFINFSDNSDLLIVLLGSVNLIVNQLSLILSAKFANDLNQNHKSNYWLFFGFYQILQIPAAFQALDSLIKNPHYWAKTDHEAVDT